MKRKLLSIILCLAMALSLLPTAALAEEEGGAAANDGTEARPYTLAELGAMKRDAYIEAQTRLGGTMYVTVGDYSYDTNGVLGNGVRDDTTGQTENRNVLNGYNSNGYLGAGNDGANGKNVVLSTVPSPAARPATPASTTSARPCCWLSPPTPT